MTRLRLTGVVTVGLALLYLTAGVAETVRAVRSGDGGVVFWFGTLVGAAALIGLGVLATPRRPRLYLALVVPGCLLGTAATAWTVVVPLLAVGVAALALVAGAEELDAQAGRA